MTSGWVQHGRLWLRLMGILLVLLLLQCSLWNIQQHLTVQSPRNRWNSLNVSWNVPAAFPQGPQSTLCWTNPEMKPSPVKEGNLLEGHSGPGCIFVNTGHTLKTSGFLKEENWKLDVDVSLTPTPWNSIQLYWYSICNNDNVIYRNTEPAGSSGRIRKKP